MAGLRARQDDVIRVGIWVLVAAGLTGLLVLLLAGRAGAGEIAEAVARELAEAPPVTSADRIEEAEALIATDRLRRLRALEQSVAETGFRVLTGSSPPKLLRSSLEALKRARNLFTRSAAEEDALRLLEVALYAGEDAPGLRPRYEELLLRSARGLAKQKLASARSALDGGSTRLARIRAERALAIWPGSLEAVELIERARLAERAREARRTRHATGRATSRETGQSRAALVEQAELAEALLLASDRHARKLAGRDRTGKLVVALTRYLGDDPRGGVAAIEELALGQDDAGSLARRWRATPDFDVASAFDRERRSYRVRRWLGLLGGTTLAERGLEVSVPGYRAWKHALGPLNLALSVPSRVFRGFEPGGTALHRAGARYLERHPEGVRANEVRDVLAGLPAQVLERHATLWDDGRFTLPRSMQSYPTLLPKPVLLSRALLRSGDVRSLPAVQALGDRDGLLLEVRHHSLDPTALRGDPALDLLAALARGLESGSLVADGGSDAAALDDLGAITWAIRSGSVLRVRGGPGAEAQLGLADTILSGGEGRERGFEVRRDAEKLTLARHLGRERLSCPAGAVCLDRARLFDLSLYAHVDVDEVPRFGARTRIGAARLGVELEASGPEASLVLPIPRWLGVERWVPFEAQISASLQGVGIWPRPLDELPD